VPNHRLDVEPAPKLPTAATSPDAYKRWRATTLGRITESLEQRGVLDCLGPTAGKRVLDLGCGDGLLTSMLAEQGAMAVGLDLDRAMLQAAVARTRPEESERARFIRGRIEQLPFRRATFDVVVAVTVLCLIPDPSLAVREAARVLRPGGRLVVGELGRWSTWVARRRLRAWFGSRLWRSAHFWTASELSTVVEGAGLTVEAVRGFVYYPPIGVLAQVMAPLDRLLGSVTTVGAAFIVVAATRSTDSLATQTEPAETPTAQRPEAGPSRSGCSPSAGTGLASPTTTTGCPPLRS
jgi:ubiquinone/menaquinone biosynthesis C-methylase UbiE